jgi:hypothetical protein
VEYATITGAAYFMLQPNERGSKQKHFLVVLDIAKIPGGCTPG